ncbi:MAG: YfhO family protein [Thermoanaerobaculia bacterium]
MAAFLLYLLAGIVLIGLAHFFVRRIEAPVALAVLLIPLCFTGRALLTGRVYGPIDLPYVTEPLNWMRGAQGLQADPHSGSLSDVACQMIPWRAAVQSSLRHGEWPLWNPYLFGGGVLAASAQPAPYSPFTLLACLLPIGTGTTFLASIWFFVAALSAFLFAREIECRESVALFAAAAWPFCTALAYLILWPLGQSWTLLPLVLLCVRRTVASSTIRSTMLLAIALALLILAGHPETTLHVVFVGSLYGIFLIARDRKNVARKLLCAVGAGALALLITALYLLPIVEALPQTRDYVDRKQLVTHWATGTSAPNAWARVAVDFFPWLHRRTWLAWTHVNAGVIETAAAGSLVIALALFAIWRVRSAECWFFTALLALGVMSGTNWQPVSAAWKTLPLFDVSFNDRLCIAAAFSFVALAAIALEFVCRTNEWRLLGLHVGTAVVVFAAASIAIDRAKLVDPNLEAWGDFKLFAEIATPAVAALMFLLPVRSRFVIASLVVLLLAQRTMEEAGVYPVLPADAAYPPIPILRSLRDVREPFRIVGQGLALIPGASTMYGLEDVRGYTAMTFEPQVETWPLWCRGQPVWFNRVDDLDRPFLSFLNVRYAITWSREREHDGWRVVASQRGSKLLENTHVIERAFIPAEVAVGDRDPLFEMELAADFRKRAWIQTAEPPRDAANGPGTVSITRKKSGFHFDVVMQRGGWLVLSEQRWTGWRAYVDGRRVAIHPANIAYIGIYVPDGKHAVEVRYWPESFVIGRVISFAAILVLVMTALARRVHSRDRVLDRHRPDPQTSV